MKPHNKVALNVALGGYISTLIISLILFHRNTNIPWQQDFFELIITLPVVSPPYLALAIYSRHRVMKAKTTNDPKAYEDTLASEKRKAAGALSAVLGPILLTMIALSERPTAGTVGWGLGVFFLWVLSILAITVTVPLGRRMEPGFTRACRWLLRSSSAEQIALVSSIAMFLVNPILFAAGEFGLVYVLLGGWHR
jgi:hypothetical protein